MVAAPPPQPPERLRDAIHAVAPHLTDTERDAWAGAIGPALHRAAVTSPKAVAAFLGQCAVESGGFRALEENLNYSAERLCQVWPARFSSAEAASPCANHPEALANLVYANRLGNGGEASGDGWRFRGRGLIQITGRANYTRFAKAMAMTLDQAIARAATPAGAADSAVWFWTANQLTILAEAGAIGAITKKVNGGLLGAAERARLTDAALHVLGA